MDTGSFCHRVVWPAPFRLPRHLHFAARARGVGHTRDARTVSSASCHCLRPGSSLLSEKPPSWLCPVAPRGGVDLREGSSPSLTSPSNTCVPTCSRPRLPLSQNTTPISKPGTEASSFPVDLSLSTASGLISKPRQLSLWYTFLRVV